MTRKRLLIIAPNVFGLLNPLIEHLEKSGSDVTICDDRFSQNFFKLALLRFARPLYFILFSKQQMRRLVTIASNFDDFLIINGEGLPINSHAWLAARANRLVFYTWDCVKNKRYISKVFKFYKSHSLPVFTFDPHDSEVFGVTYQPLFNNRFEHCLVEKQYSYCLVGTMHSQRLKFAKLFDNGLSIGKTSYIRLFCKNKIIFAFEFLKNIVNARDFVRFVEVGSMPTEEFESVMLSSEKVLDYAHPNQTGLTHRAVFALANDLTVIGNKKYLPSSTEFFVNGDVFYQTDNVAGSDFSVENWCRVVL